MARTTNQTPDVTELDDTPVAAAPAAETKAAPTADYRVVSGGLPPEFSGKRRLVTINMGEGDVGKLPVKMGINGYVILVKRNEKVAIPEEFLHLMQECTQGVILENGQRGGQSPRYTYSDFGPAN